MIKGDDNNSEQDDSGEEDEFVSLNSSPPRGGERNNGKGKGGEDEKGSMISKTKEEVGEDERVFRRYIFEMINDVGWRRMDVYGYGHDQLIDEPRWYWGGGRIRNFVVEHLVDAFMNVRDQEEVRRATRAKARIRGRGGCVIYWGGG